MRRLSQLVVVHSLRNIITRRRWRRRRLEERGKGG
jgi:hypothetical protein